MHSFYTIFLATPAFRLAVNFRFYYAVVSASASDSVKLLYLILAHLYCCQNRHNDRINTVILNIRNMSSNSAKSLKANDSCLVVTSQQCRSMLQCHFASIDHSLLPSNKPKLFGEIPNSLTERWPQRQSHRIACLCNCRHGH